jgi:hypothetical protein
MENNNKKSSFGLKNFLIGLCVGALLAVIVFLICHATLIKFANHACEPSSHIQPKPHSPYLLQRDTMDGGFSRGWMSHFTPSEEYWVDMHAHMSGITDANGLNRLLDEWFARLDAFRLGKVVAITEQDEMFKVFGEAAEKDARFAWMYWPRIDEPSLSLVREAINNGGCAIKLHNMKIMQGLTPRNIWQQDE